MVIGLWGAAFFIYYYSQGLTLIHYDAKARLLVARRIFDNLSPGIDQMGMYWLPLPALIDIPAVLSRTLYHNGIAASLISVICFAVSGYFLYRLVYLLRTDHALSVAAVLIFATNSSILYVQSTPLTESLYLALSIGGIYYLTRFLYTEETRDLLAASILVALSTLVRHDGWSLCAGMNILLLIGLLQAKARWKVKRKYIAAFLLISLAGIFAFQAYCTFVTGEFLPPQKDERPLDPYSKGQALKSFLIFLQCTRDIAGKPAFDTAILGFLIFLIHRRFRRPFLMAYALLHPIPLFAMAYFDGHPFRVRYSIVLLPAVALFAVVWWPAKRWAKIALACLIMINVLFPRANRHAMLDEARYHMPEIKEREQAIHYFEKNYDSQLVLASMGWISPFLHDWGLPLHNVVHEGIYGTWDQALARPDKIVGWIVAEDGDPLAQAAVQNPRFLRRFKQVLRLSNLTVYRRVRSGEVMHWRRAGFAARVSSSIPLPSPRRMKLQSQANSL